MLIKTVLRVIFWVLPALGVNAIPFRLVVVEGELAETVMVIYLLETFIVIAFSALFVYLVAPEDEWDDAAVTHRYRHQLLKNYLSLTIAFSAGSGVFMLLMFFLFFPVSIPISTVISSLFSITILRLISFAGYFWLLRPLSLTGAATFLEGYMSRAFVLYLSVWIGLFLITDFVLPFMAIKALADINMPFRYIQQRNQASQPSMLWDKVQVTSNVHWWGKKKRRY
jgi:hypothetical protein